MPLRPVRRASVWTSWPTWWCHLLAFVFILSAAGIHLAYLAYFCPIDLAPDEAHYWDWSRHLDWSYYSKGPLVAWLIRAGCELAGTWSEQHTGSLMFAIRLPAVVCGSLLLLSLYILTIQVYGRATLALCVVSVALTVPLIAVGSLLMTIDAPYACCWGWALVLGHRAIFRGSWWAWPLTGLVVGLGILAKYTMILWLPSVVLFLLISPEHRALLWRRGFWVMVLTMGFCCLPILIWNLQHEGVTFRHVFTLAGLITSDGEHTQKDIRIFWNGPLIMIAGQFALLLGLWFIFWVRAMLAFNPLREKNPAVRYLWCLSAPMFVVFLVFSLKTGGGELNWPVTAYASGLVLMGEWIAQQITHPTTWYRRVSIVCLTVACLINIFVTVAMHHSEWLHPQLEQLVGTPTAQHPYPLRRVDPTCRLRGWRYLAEIVDEQRERLRAEGIEPVVVGSSWNVPGELGVYCKGHPPVYSIGLALQDRHSQYDLWPGPLGQPEAFRGKTFVLVGGLTEEVQDAFDYREPTQYITYHENGRPVAAWLITICRGYRKLEVPKNKVY